MATATCPFDPDSSNYDANTGLDTVAVQLEGGAGRYRSDYLGTTFIIDVQWSLETTEFDTLFSFYYTTIKRGSIPFNINLLVQSSTLTAYVAFIIPGSFKLASQAGNSYIVVAKLEVKPNA